MTLRIAIIYGSVRTARRGIGLARWLTGFLEARGHTAILVDPADHPLPLLDRMHKEFPAGEAPEPMERIHRILDEADAFVVVSGEYNHSVPAALKNLLDHFQREYFFKPATIVTYSGGSFGGARVAPHLRAILGELGMVTTSIMFSVPKIRDAFALDGTLTDPAYERRAARFAAELEWYGEALKAKRAEGNLPF